MSQDTPIARRQVEIMQQPRPAPAARQEVRRAGVTVPVPRSACTTTATRSTARASWIWRLLAAECGTLLELEAGPRRRRGGRCAGRSGLGSVQRGRRTASQPSPGRSRSRPDEPRDQRTPRSAWPGRRSPRARVQSAPVREPTARATYWEPGTRPPGFRTHRQPAPTPMQTLRGMAVSPGIAIGPVVVLDPRGLRLPPRVDRRPTPSPASWSGSTVAWTSARIEASRAEAEARARLGPQYADILAAHGRMIADPSLHRDARKRIEREQVCGRARRRRGPRGICCPAGAARPTRTWRPAPRTSATSRQRILGQLIGGGPSRSRTSLAAPTIVLAHDLTPSEAAGLDPVRVRGFATEAGGRASHTAIVAAALEIPAVVGLGRCSSAPAIAAWPSLTATRAWSSSTPTPDAGTVPPPGRRAVGAVPGTGPPGRPARRDPRRRARRALGQHRVRRRGRRLPGPRRRRRRPVPHRVPVPQRPRAARRGASSSRPTPPSSGR